MIIHDWTTDLRLLSLYASKVRIGTAGTSSIDIAQAAKNNHMLSSLSERYPYLTFHHLQDPILSHNCELESDNLRRC